MKLTLESLVSARMTDSGMMVLKLNNYIAVHRGNLYRFKLKDFIELFGNFFYMGSLIQVVENNEVFLNETTRFNINDNVFVELSDVGLEYYNHSFDSIKHVISVPVRTDNQVKMQFWEFCGIFHNIVDSCLGSNSIDFELFN